MSNVYQSLSHSKWDCKYHVVFIPKRRKKMLYGNLAREIGPVLRDLAEQKGCQIIQGHVRPDHVHICMSIPPKFSVSNIVGFIKGKSAIWAARRNGKERNFTGEHFWARGYAVSTVGFELEQIKAYIKDQDAADESGLF
jgi:putative transposase